VRTARSNTTEPAEATSESAADDELVILHLIALLLLTLPGRKRI
jgi:hypothetical protein